MSYNSIREELNDFYFGELNNIAENIRKTVYEKMDAYDKENPKENPYKLKAKQYETIADTIEPILFDDIPFFFETGALVAHSDGRYNRGAEHANGWLYHRNEHLFKDTDPYAYDLYIDQRKAGLYTQCGIYADMMHQGIPLKKLFKVGLKGILEELYEAEKECKTDEETDFIKCSVAGIKALCTIAEKFSYTARIKGLEKLALISEKVPYNPPETVHEGLCVMAFTRKALGAIEGMGFSSFGRVDLLLGDLYESDIKKGVKEEELLDLITKFLLIWDCTLNRNIELKAAEFELENSLTLGGVDEKGKHIFNGITKLFLTARDNENIIYPKMMLRFSENSPEEYLKMIGNPLLNGKGFSLYVNDDAVIPSLISSGIEEKDALNYAVGGCWDILLPDVYLHDGGEFFSVITPICNAIHREEKKESINLSKIYFDELENSESFEELYARYLGAIRRIAMHKATFQSRGSKIWHKVNPASALSALMEPCILSKKDITNGSGKYNRETAYFTHFAETIDSLIAIKKLCFEQKVCTVSELFEECRLEWRNEVLRLKALNLPKYGDGSEEASLFTGKFVDDLHSIFYDLPTDQEGHFRLGVNHYTEIVRHRHFLPAMPNGRRKGDFLSQGLTPTRKSKSSLFDILDSLRYTDTKKFAANASMTLTLPAGNMNSARMTEFLKMVSRSGVPAVQPNCVKTEDLLAAQKDPENYGHIIVRVCGFSAPFVLLPPVFQEEVLTRTMSEV